MNIKGSKHLNLHERKKIEELLTDGENCKTIAEIIAKDERTVSREIKNRRNKTENKRYGLYGKIDEIECKKLQRFPFVCNGCDKRKYCCKKYKYFYEPDVAQDNYEIILRDCRIGLDVTLEDKEIFDSILKDGLSKGQSVHHIVQANKEKLRYSERNTYRLIDKCQTIVQAIDLRRKVKLKPRKHYVYKEDNRAIRKGRTYIDYLSFLAQNTSLFPVQIDTVESTSKGKHQCLLTMHFTAFRFMLIFVLEEKTKENVSKIFIILQRILGVEIYKKVFPVILTDRGSEFCCPEQVETDFNTGELLTKVFFCDSYSSFQKGAIEENHELIRYIIPKGILFDDLTQEKATLMSCHINSYYRKVIDNIPYHLADAFWGSDILKLLNSYPIDVNDVTLTPKLIR